MPYLLRCKRPARLLTAFVGLCYAILSLALPFQHDHQGEEAQVPLRLSGSSATARAPIPVHTQLVAKAKLAHPAHCAACEWQTTNVSPALPMFTVAFVPLSTPHVITTFPRYLRLRSLPTSSRGPPLA